MDAIIIQTIIVAAIEDLEDKKQLGEPNCFFFSKTLEILIKRDIIY